MCIRDRALLVTKKALADCLLKDRRDALASAHAEAVEAAASGSSATLYLVAVSYTHLRAHETSAHR
eukprot:15049783-Alexandrium_andersonii.AAC.1